mmetsp:Transcript_4942/g.14336  ORF Transcript_4942/g.14336 Transcript_4942/m.14336 type:complete len:268 (+) Transcript_4942:1-804(+)
MRSRGRRGRRKALWRALRWMCADPVRVDAYSSTEALRASQVLDFWLGGEQWDLEDQWHDSRSSAHAQLNRWFGAGGAVELEADKFVGLIRDSTSGQLRGEEWQSSDGRAAQLVLLAGISPLAECTVSPAEARGHEDMAGHIAADLMASFDTKPEQLHWGIAVLCIRAAARSEDLALHETARAWTERRASRGGTHSHHIEEQVQNFLLERTAVLKRFQRFPHANADRGRSARTSEQQWLDSDDCPSWAKVLWAKGRSPDSTTSGDSLG